MADSPLAKVLEAIAANVRCRRLSLGLSQEALAEALDVSGRYVQRIEQATAEPSLRMLVQLATVLRLPTIALLRSAAPSVRAIGRPPGRR